MTGLHHLFELQALRNPGAVAVVFHGMKLTYRELNARADLLAACLISRGVGANVLVGLCVQRSLEMVIGILGILKAGGAYVPIDPAYPSQRIGFILKDAAVPILLTQRSLSNDLPETGAQRLFLDEPIPEKIKPTTTFQTGNDLAYVIYTSGSTGQPKGVQIEHKSVINFLESMRSKPGLQANDVVLALTTLSFDIAGLEIFLPLTTGAQVIVGSWSTAVDGEEVRKEIERHGVTLLQATPTTWKLLLASGWTGSEKLKALCGGEPMPADLARQLLPRCAELWNMYGPTETTIWSTCSQIRDPEQISIGRPIANTETLILDSQLKPVEWGTEGELFIGGDGLARGYHNRPELTAEKFISHPFKDGERLYRTGDLARITPTGEIDCLGRLDFQIKIRGHRIELGEIESALNRHPSLQQVVAASREDSAGDKRLVAYFTTRHAEVPSPYALREHARKYLPDYMMPSAFVPVASIPLTPNGKVDRKALPAPGPDDVANDGRNTPPLTSTEKRLANIWSQTLGVSSIGRHDRFFDLGGNSLLAVRVFTELEKQFGRRLPLATLFSAPTLASLASVLDQATANTTPWTSLVSIQPAGTKPRFFCVHGAGGNVILYLSLARHLGTDFPFYGLQSQGLDGRSAPLQTIEEMAAHYVAEVQALQPNGPYYLGGYCMGGLIALEMARLLSSKGEDIALVALLDTYNFSRIVPTSRFWDLAQRLSFHAGNFFSLKPAQMKNYLQEKIRVARDGELANLFSSRKKKSSNLGQPPGGVGLRTIQAINDWAAGYYQPKPYAGQVTLFNPRINYSKFLVPYMGWDGIVQGGINVIPLPMNPHAMLVEPNVQHLSSALAGQIEYASNAGTRLHPSAKKADVP